MMAQAVRPAPSLSCGDDDDSLAMCPALPRLLHVAMTTTDQPCTLPCPVSFMWRRRQQLSHAPCPAPSPSCSGGDNNSAACPAPPHLLRAAAVTTAQPCPLPRPVSFMWRRRRQLSHAPYPAPSPSCSSSDDSSATHPTPPRLLPAAAATPAQPRALPRLLHVATTTAQPCALPHLLCVATTTTAQPCTCPTPSPLCSGGDDSSAACPAWPHLLRVATTTTAHCLKAVPVQNRIESSALQTMEIFTQFLNSLCFFFFHQLCKFLILI